MGIRLRPRSVEGSIDAFRELGGAHPCVYDLLDFARLPMGILEGAEQIVCYVNPAFCDLAGKKSEEVVGKPFSEILPEGDKCLVSLDRVYRTGNTESHTQPKDAEPHPLYWSYEIWPVLADLAGDDRRAGVIIQITETAPFHRRVTAMNEELLRATVRQHELTEAAETLNATLQIEMRERKNAQNALLRSEMLASAGRLAASIAHEINNPLDAVMNILYLARSTDGLPNSARSFLETADEELMRIAHITRQSLGFYQEAAAATKFSVSDLLTSLVQLLQAKIKSSGAAVECRCDERLEVIGVFGELRQVLANLVLNSLHAAGPDSKIVIRASACFNPNGGSRRVRITVADSGHGIEPTTMTQIFEPFFTTKEKFGTGLGLWVCKQLTDKNGVTLRVRSRTNGEHRGATFSLVFPGDSSLPADSPKKLTSDL